MPAPLCEQIANRSNQKEGWSLVFAKLTRILRGSLLLALFHHAIPAHAAIIPGAYSVTLAWDSDPSSDGVTGYRVYYGDISGDYTNSVDVGNVMSATVTGLTGGVTHFFAITAYNASGLESGFSAEVSYTPGLQTVQAQITPTRQVVLTVTGAIGHTYYIEATADLRTWTTIGTVAMLVDGIASFTDANAANFSKRFYRTRDPQP
jgi:hypothetical protein